MKVMKVLLTGLGVVTLFGGLVFIIGDRALVGAVILVIGIFLILLGLRSGRSRNVILRHELELTGDVNLEDLKCNHCGGSLSSENAAIRAGTVFISCPYCHSEYQLEEAPKW